MITSGIATGPGLLAGTAVGSGGTKVGTGCTVGVVAGMDLAERTGTRIGVSTLRGVLGKRSSHSPCADADGRAVADGMITDDIATEPGVLAGTTVGSGGIKVGMTCTVGVVTGVELAEGAGTTVGGGDSIAACRKMELRIFDCDRAISSITNKSPAADHPNFALSGNR